MVLRRITREQQEREEFACYIDALRRISHYGAEIDRLHDTLRRWLRQSDDPATVKKLLRILKQSRARLDKGHQDAPGVFSAD